MHQNSLKIEGTVSLRSGREYSAQQGHPWIFSGAIEGQPRNLDGSSLSDGAIVEVHAHSGQTIGLGFYNSRTSIAVRLFAFGAKVAKSNPEHLIFSNLEAALSSRSKWLALDVNCRRLINAEGDRLPGLIVDQYCDHLVIQIGTAGMERIKTFLIDFLISKTKANSIYERSDSASRREEGLDASVGDLVGQTPSDIIVQEGKIKLHVDVIEGQKTGFFIDQREMRKFVAEVSKDKRVLNCFSYSGGFSLAALQGGASGVVSVDASDSAIKLCEKNVQLNGFDSNLHSAKCVDAFDYLGGKHERFDLVILDPPAFAKKKEHVKNALKAYRQIAQSGIKLINPGGMLITCSCSNFVSQSDFEQEVVKAATESGRAISIVGRHRHAVDHPVSAVHEQGAYLKSLILLVNWDVDYKE